MIIDVHSLTLYDTDTSYQGFSSFRLLEREKAGGEILILRFMHNNVFTLPVSFTGSYTEDQSHILLGQNNLILQKRCLA